jgi:hypothetical protein
MHRGLAGVVFDKKYAVVHACMLCEQVLSYIQVPRAGATATSHDKSSKLVYDVRHDCSLCTTSNIHDHIHTIASDGCCSNSNELSQLWKVHAINVDALHTCTSMHIEYCQCCVTHMHEAIYRGTFRCHPHWFTHAQVDSNKQVVVDAAEHAHFWLIRSHRGVEEETHIQSSTVCSPRPKVSWE